MRRLASTLVGVFALLVATAPGVASSGVPNVDEAQTEAAAPGSVLWRFQVNGQYILQRPAVGPDGGVVVASSAGDVYSLTSAGALRWVVPGVGGSGGPSIGADGTVYVASGSTITAIAAGGAVSWTFTEPSSGQGVIAGPTVGPDGNVYVISDMGGLGAFALSPSGTLLWSNPGDPVFAENGQLGAEIVFGSGQLYAGFDERSVAFSTLFALTLDGDQQWAREIGGADDTVMQQQRQPATGSDGSLYMSAFGGANGWGLRKVDPTDGDVIFNYSPFPSNGMSAPSVGPDGSVYFSRSLSFLESVTSAGQSRWVFTDGSIIDHPAVSPDGGVVVAGVRPNFGEPGLVRGWNAATGAVNWQIDLPDENGGNQILYSQPSFSADGGTAYFGTAILGGDEDGAFVYAVETGPDGPPPSFTLSVSKAGSGSGTVTSSPAGIDCGTDCTEAYTSGTSVTLSAAPAAGSTFAGWSGACTGTGSCVVSMTQARSVTATFNLSGGGPFTLTVTTVGSGRVRSTPAGIDCGTDCTEAYASGTSVTLTPRAQGGSTFAGWSGACTGTGSCVVSMTQARSVTATFTTGGGTFTLSG